VIPLPGEPRLPAALHSRLLQDVERFSKGLPGDINAWARERYGVDLSGEYAGRKVRVPFGKASGQLSMNTAEVAADAAAGLGFVVLKTVIAEDSAGERSMAAWAVRESAMRVERRVSQSGLEGWTVTWKGRGWDRSFEEYLVLYRAALEAGAAAAMPVAASVKYDLPPAGQPFREDEYAHTTRSLAAVGGPDTIIEKDFSPTLAGDDRSREREAILRWIERVPPLVLAQAPVTLGMKLMNARFDDSFQVTMLETARATEAAFLVCFNRLFDAERGVAYGGWDLSDRNLRVLDRARIGWRPAERPRFSATGNIISGRVMAEYARRGASSGQLHTVFQLPPEAYLARAGSRSARALHSLLLDPREGLIAWMLHLGESGELHSRGGLLHFLDIAPGAGPDA
jgi:hypothetical protein